MSTISDPFDDNSNPENLLREQIEGLKELFETLRKTPPEEFQADGIKEDATDVLNMAQKCITHSVSLRGNMFELRDSIDDFLASLRFRYVEGNFDSSDVIRRMADLIELADKATSGEDASLAGAWDALNQLNTAVSNWNDAIAKLKDLQNTRMEYEEKYEEERRRKEEEEEERRRKEEQERMQREKEERKRQEEKRRREEEDRIAEEKRREEQEAEDRRRREQEERERLAQEEQDRKDEERRRKKQEAEERRRKEQEEQQRKKQEAEERKRREEEKRAEKARKAREEQEEKKRKADEQRKKLEEERKKARKAEEDRKNAEKQKRIEEEKRKKAEEDEKRRLQKEKEEKKRKAREAAEKKRKEAERKRAEELRRKEEEERRKKQEAEDRKRREEEEERKRQKEAEDRKRKEEEEKRIAKEAEERKRREEERRRKEQEARERKKKEEEERKIREAEERANNPKNWPPFWYPFVGDEDYVGTGNGCVVRAKQESLEKEMLKCFSINPIECDAPENDYEEVISNVICLQSNGDPLTFEQPLRVSIPFCAVKLSTSKESVVRLRHKDQEWTTEEGTRDFNIESEDNRKFPALTVAISSLDSIEMLVILRPTKCPLKVNKNSVTHKSIVDERVALTVPQGAFLLPTEIGLEVIPVDLHTLAGLQSKKGGCENVVGLTPIIILNGEEMPNRTLQLTVPGLISREVNPKPAPGIAFNSRVLSKNQLFLQGENPARFHILTKLQDKWGVDPEANPRVVGNKIKFGVNHLKGTRYTVMETKGKVSYEEAARNAGKLEECLSETVVRLVFKQKKGPNERVCEGSAEIFHSSKCEDALLSLETDGFTDGPRPSEEMCMKEGQRLLYSFDGNIESVDEEVHGAQYRMSIFRRNMETTRRQFLLKASNEFGNRFRDLYHGNLCLDELRMMDPAQQEHETGQRFTSLPVTLQKVEREKTIIEREPVKIKWQEPLNDEYVNDLSEKLKNNGKSLATELGIRTSTIDEIWRRNLNDKDTNYAVLVTWYQKSAGDPIERAEYLCEGLWQCRLDDLEKELTDRIRAAIRDRKVKAGFEEVSQSDCRNDWKMIVRSLPAPISDGDIDEIIESDLQKSLNKRFYKGLVMWWEKGFRTSTPGNVLELIRTALVGKNYNAVAEKLDVHIRACR